MNPEDRSYDPDLGRYLQVIVRRKWVVVLAIAIVLATAVVDSFAQTSVYQATALLLITPTVNASSVLNQSGAAGAPTVQDVQTQIEIITSGPVKDEVKSEFGVAPPVSVSEVGQTTVVQVRSSSTIARQAAEVANAYANDYVTSQRTQAINNLQTAGAQVQSRIDALQTQIETVDGEVATAPAKDQANLSTQLQNLLAQQGVFKQQLAQLQLNASVATGGGQVVTAAVTPTTPSSPRPDRTAVIALLVGLLYGIVLCFALDYLDDSVRSREDADRAAQGVPSLGFIPRIAGWKPTDRPRIVSLDEPKSPAAEAYRSIRTSIQFVGIDHPLQIIQVTSASAEEGKTTTLANLAVALASSGDRVCMCCCDLRRPRIHEFFGLDNAIGLTSVILGLASSSEAVTRVPGVERLWLLPSGPLPPNPSELLASERAAEVIRSLATLFDVVLLDSPPVLPVTDSAIVSAVADATVVVIHMGESTRREVARTMEILDQVHALVIGTVLNGISRETSDGYYRYAGYYGARAESHPQSDEFLETVARER